MAVFSTFGFRSSGIVCQIVKGDKHNSTDKLIIYTESQEGNDNYVPATSVTLYYSDSLITLRDKLIEAFPLDNNIS